MSITFTCAPRGGWFALCWSRPRQDGQVCPLRSPAWCIRRQRGESGQCQECLRTTGEHFRFKLDPEVPALYTGSALGLQNIHIHLPVSVVPQFSSCCFSSAVPLICSVFQPGRHRLNRSSFSVFTGVWHYFWVCWSPPVSEVPLSGISTGAADSCFTHVRSKPQSASECGWQRKLLCMFTFFTVAQPPQLD